MASPVLSRREIVGSVVMPAWILSCCMAAMKVSPAPTGTEVNSPSFTPFLTARYWVRKLVEEPRPGDAEALALEVGRRLDLGMLGRDQLDLARRLAELDDRFDELALGLQIDAVVVEADHALHRAGQHLVLGIDAGRLVQQLDVEALVLEVAERLGELGRQVDLLLVAADHDGDLVGGLRRRVAASVAARMVVAIAVAFSRMRASGMKSSLVVGGTPLVLVVQRRRRGYACCTI